VRKEEILVGLDLGSSRTKAVVANVADSELPEVLGTGEVRSDGISAGVIVNMERAAVCIRAAVEAAEESAQVDIGKVSISLGGEHMKGIDSRGVIAVSSSGGEITPSEVAAVLEAAKTLALPVGRAVVDVLPQEFFVDGQRGVRDPVGMSGVRLGSKVHIVTASQQVIENTARAARRAGLNVSAVTLKPLAAGRSCLSDDERELGVLLVCVGGDTTGLVLYHGGAVRHTAVIGWGAASITNDIAVGLRIPVAKAEQLKRESGCAKASLAEDAPIEIPSVGGRAPTESSTQVLAAIIEPRVREILEMAVGEVGSTDYWGRIPAGVVLTGGGARLHGLADVAEEVFGAPARIGIPDRASGAFDAISDPAYSAAVGMILSSAGSSGMARPWRGGALADTVQKVRQWVDSLL
jgi:cell division protein FtsA